ncbi:MAG: CBS domain-containing protein [Halobacteriaceae archaeon]
MKVADIMTPRSETVTVELPGTRDDALNYLQEQRFSSIPVVKETESGEIYRGLITREDLIEEPDEDQLALLMKEVPTIKTDDTIVDVANLIVSEKSRRIPVVENDKLQGIITVTDIINAIATGELDGEKEVGSVTSNTVNTVYQDTPLIPAEREISFANVPYAVVLDNHGEMVGMLTEVDILDVARVVEGEAETGASIANEDDEWMWEGIKAVGNRYLPTRNVEIPNEPVNNFMTEEVITVSGNRTIEETAQIMIREDIEQVPLVRANDLTGIVRDVDLVQSLL